MAISYSQLVNKINSCLLLNKATIELICDRFANSNIKNPIFGLLGPAGSGKSSLIKYLSKHGMPSIDLESFSAPSRPQVLTLWLKGVFGAADLSPKNYDDPRIVWINLEVNQKIYEDRREDRDEDQPEKGLQPRQNVNEWKHAFDFNDQVIHFNNDLEIKQAGHSLLTVISYIRRRITHCKAEKLNLVNISNVIRLCKIKPGEFNKSRKLRLHGKEIIDCTPGCLFGAFKHETEHSPSKVNEIIDELILKNGKYYEQRPYERKITEALHKDKLCRQRFAWNKLLVKNRPQNENELLFPLPPIGVEIGGKTNNSELSGLDFNDPEAYVFLGNLIKDLLDHVDTDEEVRQVANLFTDWRCTVGFSLSAGYLELFSSSETEDEKRLKEITAGILSPYLHACLESAINCSDDEKISEYNAKLNEHKKMGPCPAFDRTPIDNNLFTYVPNQLLDSANRELNAWVVETNLPYKMEWLAHWQEQMDIIYSLFLKYDFEDPQLWIELTRLDLCPCNSTAFRINGNDEIQLVVNVDKSTPIWKVELKRITLEDKKQLKLFCDQMIEFGQHQMKDPMWLITKGYPNLPLAGKPREWVVNDTPYSFFMEYLSPYQFKCIYNESLMSINRERVKKYGSDLRRMYIPCLMAANKIRQMYPGHWFINEYYSSIARMYSTPLEKCDLGFLVLDAGDPNYLRYNSIINSYINSLVVSSDVSHSETTMSSDFILMDLLGHDPALRAFFRFACSGLSATKKGARFHDMQVSSGISFTTFCNIIAGIHKTALLFSYVTIPSKREEVYKSAVKILLAHAYLYLHEKFGTDIPSDYIELSQKFVFTIPTVYGDVDILHFCGTDDQIWYCLSNVVSKENMRKLWDSSIVKEFTDRYHINVDVGDSTHFGAKLTSYGYEANSRGTLAKVTSHEKKEQGDAIATGIQECNNQNKFFFPCLQRALDSINAGSVQAYSKGSDLFLSLIQYLPDYADALLQEYNAPYSKTGKTLSDALKKVGYDSSQTKKVPISITRDILKHHKLILAKIRESRHYGA